VNATTELDRSNRVSLTRDILRAAGFLDGDKLLVSASPGRIVLECKPNRGKVIKRGNLKLWNGPVPSIPLDEAVEQVRHYQR